MQDRNTELTEKLPDLEKFLNEPSFRIGPGVDGGDGAFWF